MRRPSGAPALIVVRAENECDTGDPSVNWRRRSSPSSGLRSVGVELFLALVGFSNGRQADATAILRQLGNRLSRSRKYRVDSAVVADGV